MACNFEPGWYIFVFDIMKMNNAQQFHHHHHVDICPMAGER